MDLSRSFHISVYGSAAFAGMMLALAEATSLPTALTVLVALSSLVVIERTGWSRGFPPWISNILGIAAFGVAASEFFGGTIESRLLSGAHLLVYLQWIVLCQQKTRRQYWAICALALLQVAVGSVLTDEGWYGMLLVLFLLLQIWTLTVFSLLEAKQRFANSLAHVDGPSAPSTDGLAGLFDNASVAPDSIQIDPGETWINRRLVISIVGMVFLSLVVSSALFAFTPRLWISGRISEADAGDQAVRTMTGFSERVRLGDMGQIVESSERVMTVRLFDNDTNEQIDIFEFARSNNQDEPYFRGGSMYNYNSGVWSPSRRYAGHQSITGPEPKPGMVRQEIELEEVGTSYLFLMQPYYSVTIEIDGKRLPGHCWVLGSMVTMPPLFRDSAASKYSVISPRPGTDQPSFNAWSAYSKSREIDIIRRAYSKFPDFGLERVRALANSVAYRDTDRQTPNYKIRAERLTDHLSGGTYGYTLDASIEDPDIDPIEDFLFNRKKGHCDYYASSLTLMLRAVGVPARLVNGFKGGYTNSLSGGLEVQQRHAHAWVEAYYDGRWNLLDATPSSARSESIVQYDPQFRVLNDVGSSLGDLWDRFVVDVSLEGQQRSIYAPLLEAFKDWIPGTTADSFRGFLDFALDPKRWISWTGGVIAFLIMLASALLYRLHPLRRLINLLRQFGLTRGHRDTTEKIVVAFYERFYALCQTHNLIRSTGQTHQEFAEVVTRQFQPQLSAANLIAVPGEVTAFFYDVRFGARDLSNQQIVEIDSQLASLEQCLGTEPDPNRHR